MKTVKILSMTLLLSIFCAGMTFAQQQNQTQQQNRKVRKEQSVQKPKVTAEERAAKHVEMMKDSLNLTSDQVTKLQALQTQVAKDQEQARTARENAQQDMKAKKDAYDAQVKFILTPEQYQKYQEQRVNMMKKGDVKGKAMKKEIFKKAVKDNRQGKVNKTQKAEQVQE